MYIIFVRIICCECYEVEWGVGWWGKKNCEKKIGVVDCICVCYMKFVFLSRVYFDILLLIKWV